MRILTDDLKKRAMVADEIRDLLNRAEVGRVAMLNPDGTPYVVPVHFAFRGDRVYFHCAMPGKKIENIRTDARVCFECDEVLSIEITPEKPCSCGTFYRSVIANGVAVIVDDPAKKLQALMLLMEKYAKGGNYGRMSDEVIAETCVVEIVIDTISGKARLPIIK